MEQGRESLETAHFLITLIRTREERTSLTSWSRCLLSIRLKAKRSERNEVPTSHHTDFPTFAMESDFNHTFWTQAGSCSQSRPGCFSQHWRSSCCSLSPLLHLHFPAGQPTATGPRAGGDASWWIWPDHRNTSMRESGLHWQPDQGKTVGMKTNGSGKSRRQNQGVFSFCFTASLG